MALILSLSHDTARQQAARLPALQASYGLLTVGDNNAVIIFYEGVPGVGTLLAEIAIPTANLTLDAGAYQIKTTGTLEGQVATAGAVSHARILDRNGDIWGDATVTDEAGEGDIKLQETTLQAGAFVRITSATLQG